MAPNKAGSVEEERLATVKTSNGRPSYVPPPSSPIPIVKRRPIDLTFMCRAKYLRPKPLPVVSTAKVSPTLSGLPKTTCPTKSTFCQCYQ